MNLEILQTIPNWQARLEYKILEKRAFYGQDLLRAAGHGAGSGAKWGAGLGALYGGGKAAVSDDESIVGGALRGGVKGGVMGAGLGAVGGAGLRYGGDMLGDASGAAATMGYDPLAASLLRGSTTGNAARQAAGLGSMQPPLQALLDPAWYTRFRAYTG